MMIKSQIVVFVIIIVICIAVVHCSYPVPIPPGGRFGSHAWLIMPTDQPKPTNAAAQPVQGWFMHHTPLFGADSPHNFQIIFNGSLSPLSIADNITYPISMPYPPKDNSFNNEYTLSPPVDFSLNDLLSGKITRLLGPVTNGSFDTASQEDIAVAYLNINHLTTAVWLNDSSKVIPFPNMRYLSYPRSSFNITGIQYFYFVHEIHTAPDFDQAALVQVAMDSCYCEGFCPYNSLLYDLIYTPGISWEIVGHPNDVKHRLVAKNVFPAQIVYKKDAVITCKIQVVEQFHCTLGPVFADPCK